MVSQVGGDNGENFSLLENGRRKKLVSGKNTQGSLKLSHMPKPLIITSPLNKSK